jgi:two-component system phosphate regulon sensor histidine kinase PhoR
MNIRWKLTLGSLLAVSLGLAIAGALALRSIERLETGRLTDTLVARANLAALSLESGLRSGTGPAGLQRAAKELGRRAQARITVIRPDGTVLADSYTADEAVPTIESHAARPEVVEALRSGLGTDVRLSGTVGLRMLYLAIPVGPPGAPAGIVRLAVPLTELEAQVRKLEYALGIAFGVAFLVSVILSILLARGVTGPFAEMAAVARRLADGAIGERIRTSSRDELGVLATTLNSMADQLETTILEVSDERAQLLGILRSMVEGIMVLDGRGTVLLINPALERMLGVRASEVAGRSYQEALPHDDLKDLATKVLIIRETQSVELALSGLTFRIDAIVVAGRAPNEPCAVLVFHDITALRRLEHVRRDFVANVSHELRTPLTSIKGYVEALLDGAKDNPDESRQFLEIILKQSDRLNLILEDLLQLSQIESGQVVFKRDAVRLEAVVDRTLSLIRPLSEKKGHILHVMLPPGLPAVCGDEERLVQVLTNLLDNAVKYTPSHGTITVDAKAAEQADAVELRVSDTGPGIPEADRPRVFERFYRVDKARSREMGGTGLGLAIVRHIVEGHGGQVWVEGLQPSGSRFVVRLPAAQPVETHPATDRPKDSAA